jgi:hypothetical protein
MYKLIDPEVELERWNDAYECDYHYNYDLDLYVVVIGDGLDYSVEYFQHGEVIRSFEMGLSSGMGYYCAEDIARQYPHLPKEYLLYEVSK